MFRGYAAGVNHYVRTHVEELPAWVEPSFTPHDVAALWIGRVNKKKIERFLELQFDRAKLEEELHLVDNEGSNAWSFAPSRTVSGHTILLRNFHLSWDAGYSEAHITVPGIINFYGDFRVGRSLFYNGRFNEYLGWSTTNNYPDLDKIYTLEFDPDDVPANFPEPRLGLRSQLALELVDNDHNLTLEEVADLKHSMWMLLADRIKGELIVAVRSSNPEPELNRAIEVTENWDNTVAMLMLSI